MAKRKKIKRLNLVIRELEPIRAPSAGRNGGGGGGGGRGGRGRWGSGSGDGISGTW